MKTMSWKIASLSFVLAGATIDCAAALPPAAAMGVIGGTMQGASGATASGYVVRRRTFIGPRGVYSRTIVARRGYYGRPFYGRTVIRRGYLAPRVICAARSFCGPRGCIVRRVCR